MRKGMKKLSVFSLAAILALLPAESAMASTKTDAEKMLKYYKRGNITMAKKYNSRLPKKADNTSIKKLPELAKKWYAEIVTSYSLDVDINGEEYLWGYYLADLDGDKKAELLVEHGTSEADVVTDVYTFKKGKLKKLGKTYASHGVYYAYPKHAGVILGAGTQGVESTKLIRVKKGKLKEISYGTRELQLGEKYFPFRQKLNNHIKYNKSGKRVISLKDLK